MKLWQGRLDAENRAMLDFESSIKFDKRLWREDLSGSIAHAQMLGDTGVLSPEDSAKIVAGLKGIFKDLESGALPIDACAEDIHTFVEQELTRRIGDAGKKLHTARSRNDQVALDLRLWLNERIDQTKRALSELEDTLLTLAKAHTQTLMPGYTHMQRAQPQVFAQHLLAYGQMFLRDYDRLCDAQKRTCISPLGSGALAGTGYAIDRETTARALGFTAPCENALDGVSDRDFAAEFLFCASLAMTHLSRLSEELVLWSSAEFSFIELSDEYSTGSSMMPQKKNPDAAELCRGKTGRVYGDLIALLTVLKGLPLAYQKDLQEDKEAVFDAADTLLSCLSITNGMLSTMRVNADAMRAATRDGYLTATDLADDLVKKGVPFRDAYAIVGKLVKGAAASGERLEDLPLSTLRGACDRIGEDVYEVLDPEKAAKRRSSFGGPGDVDRQLSALQSALESRKEQA